MKTLLQILIYLGIGFGSAIFIIMPLSLGYWSMKNMESFEIPTKYWIQALLAILIISVLVLISLTKK